MLCNPHCGVLRMKTKKNAQREPQVYVGLHMVEGVAEYKDAPDQEAYRILLSEKTIKDMDKTFRGKPVYVDHVDSVDLENIQMEADGYVVESFYNKADGKHWCKFIVVSDKGHDAIAKGFKLSNAYIPKNHSAGGLWHGVEYLHEVTEGEYEHLAIVNNPRYAESVILTPEGFKEYNEQKEDELKQIANSLENKGETSMLKFFKKQKVENAADLESTSVVLPKSKKEVTLNEAIEMADKVANMAGYADPSHMVKLGEDEMSVENLCESYDSLKSEMDELKASSEDSKENEEDKEDDKKENEDSEDSKENDEDSKENEDEDSKENEEEEAKKNALEKKKLSNENFDKLKDAPAKAMANGFKAIEFSQDQVARGQSRYGSSK